MIWTMLNTWRAELIIRGSRHRVALQDLPGNLYEFWKSSARREFPGIPQDAVFFARAADGLLDFFDAVARNRAPCALPSMAADSVWHAWQRLAPIKLETFCRKHFGRFIPHIEQEAMPGNMDAALAACLVRAREGEGIAPQGPRLPKLFLLDRTVKMPHGYGYRVMRGQPEYSRLDGEGRMSPVASCPPAMAAVGLLGAGLITQAEFEAHAERARQHNSSGSSCGSGCGSSISASCDSSDGGSCDGGSSCGSSCGGGGD